MQGDVLTFSQQVCTPVTHQQSPVLDPLINKKTKWPSGDCQSVGIRLLKLFFLFVPKTLVAFHPGGLIGTLTFKLGFPRI